MGGITNRQFEALGIRGPMPTWGTGRDEILKIMKIFNSDVWDVGLLRVFARAKNDPANFFFSH